jgi:hypothetical protein
MEVKRWCIRGGMSLGACGLFLWPMLAIASAQPSAQSPQELAGYRQVIRLSAADGSYIYQTSSGEQPYNEPSQPPKPTPPPPPLAPKPQPTTPTCAVQGDMHQLCTTQGLTLSPKATSSEALIQQFAAQRATLDRVLRAPTRAMAHGKCGQQRIDLPMPIQYCMPGADQTNRWMLQGITGQGESGWPAAEGLDLTIVSAYYNKRGPKFEHARISLINNATGRLSHVRLVEAKAGRQAGCATQNEVSLCQFVSHAGGLAWAGQYLYMAGASNLHVFDLSQFVQLGDEYVLPEVRRYGVAGPQNFKMAYVSIDTSRHELLAGPYLPETTTEPIVHWPLRADGSIADMQASYGVATSGRQPSIRIQGAASHSGTYFLSQSGSLQTKEKDYLYVVRPGGQAEQRPWHYGAEDLYIDPIRQLLWGAGEVAGRRSVVAVDISRYLPPLAE